MIKSNTLIFDDFLKVLPEIKTGSVDMILTDPPQNKLWLKWDKDFIKMEKMWSEFNRVIKPNGAILIFGSEPFSSYLRMANIKYYRYDIVWDKMSTTNFVNAKKMPLNNYELISVFYKEQPTYNPILIDADPKKVRPKYDPVLNMSHSNLISTGIVKNYSPDYNINKRYPTKIISISSKEKECNSHKRQHPAQKPISLCERLISMYSNKGDLILDTFMGVGSVCVSASNLKRKFIGIEKSSKYFKLSVKKLETVKGIQIRK